MNAIKEADQKNPDSRITQFVIIIDMAGFSFMTLLNVYGQLFFHGYFCMRKKSIKKNNFTAVQLGLSMLSEYEANYPETLSSCFLINCTSAIGMLLNLVKGALAEKTFNKIKVDFSNFF